MFAIFYRLMFPLAQFDTEKKTHNRNQKARIYANSDLSSSDKIENKNRIYANSDPIKLRQLTACLE